MMMRSPKARRSHFLRATRQHTWPELRLRGARPDRPIRPATQKKALGPKLASCTGVPRRKGHKLLLSDFRPTSCQQSGSPCRVAIMQNRREHLETAEGAGCLSTSRSAKPDLPGLAPWGEPEQSSPDRMRGLDD